MQDKKHKGKGLNFTGQPGYYGAMSGHDGFGGFNYTGDFEYMNSSTWTKPGGPGYQIGWCDTGYQNIAAAAKTTGLAWIYDYGVMETASSHSFKLESFLATDSWSANQSWEIISYTESNGQLTEKGSMDIKTTFSKAETFKFKGADWKGIAAVAFEVLSYGSPGNTCSYGTAEYGLQMCLDQVKVKFSKKADLKHNGGNILTPYQLAHHQAAAHVAVASHVAHVDSSHAAANANSGVHHTDTGYHTQLFSLGHESGLTSQFHLPAVEHLA